MYKQIQCPTSVILWRTIRSFDRTMTRYHNVSLPYSESIDFFIIRNNVALAISSEGNIYIWGSLGKKLKTNFVDLDFLNLRPTIVEGLRNIKISSLTCNDSVALFLSNDGIAYSYGVDELQCGILGLGNTFVQTTAQQIKSLINHKITQISIGNTHACAVTALGNLFTWGTGLTGQLGIKNVKKTLIPTLVDCAKVFGVKQAICSQYSSAILTRLLFLTARRWIRLYL